MEAWSSTFVRKGGTAAGGLAQACCGSVDSWAWACFALLLCFPESQHNAQDGASSAVHEFRNAISLDSASAVCMAEGTVYISGALAHTCGAHVLPQCRQQEACHSPT